MYLGRFKISFFSSFLTPSGRVSIGGGGRGEGEGEGWVYELFVGAYFMTVLFCAQGMEIAKVGGIWNLGLGNGSHFNQ